MPTSAGNRYVYVISKVLAFSAKLRTVFRIKSACAMRPLAYENMAVSPGATQFSSGNVWLAGKTICFEDVSLDFEY
jgi:hypothetical protein